MDNKENQKNVFQMLHDGDRVDLTADYFKPAVDEMMRTRVLCHRLNLDFRPDEDYSAVLNEIFGCDMSGTRILQPFTIDFGNQTHIAPGAFINHSFVGSCAAGVTIEEGVQIAPQVTVLTVNHDPYERHICICRPVHIKKFAWIGARAIIMPGVTVGENAIVGSGAIVTHDVPDNAIVVGTPARVIKMLDPEKQKSKCNASSRKEASNTIKCQEEAADLKNLMLGME